MGAVAIFERIENLTPLGTWLLPLAVSVILAIVLVIVLYSGTKSRTVRYKFITIGSHKLRTPLSRIKVAVAELIVRKEAADKEEEQYVIGDYEDRLLRQISIDNNRLIGLVNLLLEVAEDTTGGSHYDIEAIDIVAIVRETLEAYQQSQWRNNRMFISFEATEPEIFVRADKRRITTVIRVLLENGIIYSPGGGKMTVSVLNNEHGKVRVSVADEGMGIAENERKFIFTKFYRSERALKIHTEGTGIGLFLAKRIIEGHGGKMWFESKGEYEGSVFSFTLPAGKPPKKEEEKKS